MKAYILSVCGAVIISALVVILLPDGKTGKFINGILKLFCLLVMLVPLFGFIRDFRIEQRGEVASEIALDENFIDHFYGEIAAEEEAMLKKRLEKEYSVTLSVQIGWEFVEYAYNISNVSIKIENFGMYGEDEHILVISEIRNRASEILQTDTEVISVYE